MDIAARRRGLLFGLRENRNGGARRGRRLALMAASAAALVAVPIAAPAAQAGTWHTYYSAPLPVAPTYAHSSVSFDQWTEGYAMESCSGGTWTKRMVTENSRAYRAPVPGQLLHDDAVRPPGRSDPNGVHGHDRRREQLGQLPLERLRRSKR
jgi:hypothetical protein